MRSVRGCPTFAIFALVYLAYLIGVLASFPVVGVLLALHSERSFFSKVIDGPAPLTVIIAGFWMGRFCYLRLPHPNCSPRLDSAGIVLELERVELAENHVRL